MSNQIKAAEVVTYGRKFAWIPGFYHSKALKKHFLYNEMRAFCLTVSYLFPVLILLFLIVEKLNVKTIYTETIYLMGAIWCSAKISLHIYNLPKLRVLEDLLEAEVFNMHTQQQNHFMYRTKTMIMYVFRGYYFVCCAAATVFVMCPLVSNFSITIPIWIPFSGEMEHNFVYIYESVYMIAGCYTYPIVDYTLIGLILMAIAQVGVLEDNLKYSTNRDIDEDYLTQEKKIQARLRKCVIHHNAILDFVAKVQDMLSSFFFLQIFFSGIELCMLAIGLFVVADHSQTVIQTVLFLGVAGQITIICWCGQQLIDKSSAISEACYMSEWYTCSVPTRKLLLIIMTNSQAPLTLYGGKFFAISYNTFVNIIRNAYSYYIVFRQFYHR